MGACAWFVSLDVDFLVANVHNVPHWLLQLFRALFMGVSVAIGYAVYRKYLLEIRTRSKKYAEIREQICRLLADLLTTRDEDLIQQLRRTIQRIEQVLKRYDPKSVHLGREEIRDRTKRRMFIRLSASDLLRLRGLDGGHPLPKSAIILGRILGVETL